MLKKLSSKLFSIILIFVMSVLIIGPVQKYARRLLHFPKTFETIESADSELLHRLMNKSAFSSDWQWDLIITYQQYHWNNDTNVQEWANRQLVGYHDGHDVRLFHTITMYRELAHEITVEPMSDIGMNVDKITVSIPQDSTFLPPVCYMGVNNKKIPITDCILDRKYDSIHEKIDVVVYGKANIKEITDLVHNLVMFFDGKEVNIR